MFYNGVAIFLDSDSINKMFLLRRRFQKNNRGRKNYNKFIAIFQLIFMGRISFFSIQSVTLVHQ